MTRSQTRREFLQTTSALMLGAAGMSAAEAQQQLAAPGQDESYWEMVRAQFSFTEETVPMNAANLCPSFRAVAENVSLLTADIDRDCSFNNRAKFGDLLEETRARVAAQLNVSADEVALVRNTSEANNIVNGGLPLQSGDDVLVWDQNHPTNNVAWEVRAARYGLQVRKVGTPEAPQSAQELVDAFTDEFRDRTAVLAITHVSNVSGIKLPVKELTRLAHERGIHVHLDGAQTWGAMAVDLRDLDVDSYSASAHKWYMGPKEVGLLYVRESRIGEIWPSVVAPGWGNGPESTLTGARKFESLGQRDDAALAGLGVAAGIHDLIGPRRVEQRIAQLAQHLKQGIADAGFDLLTPMAPEFSHGVCITKLDPEQRGETVDRLYREHGIAGAATGGLRLCPTIYNTLEHVDRAAAGVRALLG
ncbi:MAG: aminotransferase class V-fold PLP-dependent enzyme [Gammaproteobacteria bacterium]|nr:aminotransferase class V-fold PLP-dependent enzyme [Gammaproteobacteria bacterium]